MSENGKPRNGGRLGLAAWALYDLANSAFPTVIVTFVFAAYFAKAVAPNETEGTALWGMAMAISGVTVALLAPIFGAISDRGGPRKPWLFGFTLLCLISGSGLWFVAPEQDYVALALILAGLANAAFEFGQVFYNAMLPDLAPREKFGRISGWAWGLGYVGGLFCLAITLLVFVQPEVPPFGLDAATQEQIRIVGPFVAVWFLIFALPLFFFTPDRPRRAKPPGRAVRESIRELIGTLKGLKQRPWIIRFLVARLLYIDGLATLFAFGGIYAAGTFGMAVEEILAFGILLNVTAGLGAFVFGWFDDRFGAKPTIEISLVCLIVLSIALLLAEGAIWFWILGALLGIFIGPVQASSRSLMAHLAPPEQTTQLFGLFALSGKVTAFLGPAFVAGLTALFDSQRIGMSIIVVLFALGLLVLRPLKVVEAR
ncbi:MAG: MFS transporter [Rhodospirillales bacterium]